MPVQELWATVSLPYGPKPHKIKCKGCNDSRRFVAYPHDADPLSCAFDRTKHVNIGIFCSLHQRQSGAHYV